VPTNVANLDSSLGFKTHPWQTFNPRAVVNKHKQPDSNRLFGLFTS